MEDTPVRRRQHQPPVFGHPKVMTEQLSKDDIHARIEAMVETAVLMKACGFDGIDVHGLHWGYGLEEFIWDCTNQRTDEYNGTLEDRLRPCREIIDGIREKCGVDYPVTIRIDTQSHFAGPDRPAFTSAEEAGITPEIAKQIAIILEKWGYDAIMTDSGVFESMIYSVSPCYIPRGYTVENAAAIKNA
jgi:2-enoate reductase